MTTTIERPRVERQARDETLPYIRTTDDLVTWWSEQIHSREPATEHRERSSIIMRGDRLFHYGTHFELARIIRRKSGRTRLVLCNGDRYSGSGGYGPSTWSRQMQVQRAVREQIKGTNIEMLIVPFSALEAANVDFTTLQPLHVRPDRNEVREHTSTERPGPNVQVPDPTGATTMVPHTRYGWLDEDGNPAPDSRSREGLTYGAYTHLQEEPVLVDDPDHAHVEPNRPDGVWRWSTEHHYLGDSLFRARVRMSERYTNEDGHTDYRWRTYTAKFLSSFDYGEPNAPYFLCELRRRCPANTVEEAIADLMPDEVRDLIAQGVEVLRQGDVFAIPTDLSSKDLRAIAEPATVRHLRGRPDGPAVWEYEETPVRRRSDGGGLAYVMGTNHVATYVIKTKDGQFYGKGTLYHQPRQSWRAPEHRRLKLGDGKTWYRFVKNTVPLDKGTGSSRGSSAQQSGDSRAWTMGGQVD
jgi:hypothetical protein